MGRSIHCLSQTEFEDGWRAIIGGLPSAPFKDRSTQILDLVESIPALPLPGDITPVSDEGQVEAADDGAGRFASLMRGRKLRLPYPVRGRGDRHLE